MERTILRPLANPLYRIKQSLVVAQCDGMRVIDQTLAPGEAVPWHLHPDNDDYIICLRGELEIREIAPDQVTRLRPNDRHFIASKRPHTTLNTSGEDCQFLIVQPGKVEFRPLPRLEGSTR